MGGSVNNKSNTYPVIELAKYVQAHGDQQSLFGEGEGYGHYLGMYGDVWDLIYAINAAHFSKCSLPEPLLSAAVDDILDDLTYGSSRELNRKLELIGSPLRVPLIPEEEEPIIVEITPS
ncbi:hypothetical protein [Actinotignum sp. GS-2025b]|uniref:hypothetical protein n=1 Tax=Actinotignum sp. GS-2025b TaxID=3427275 RepID=UPI003F452B75